MITVIIPTLGRPGRMQAVACNIAEATHSPVWPVFVVEASDVDSCEEAARLAQAGLCGWCANMRTPNYAGAVNTACLVLDSLGGTPGSPYVFLGADDVLFHDGWDTPALAAMTGDVRVVGTNDLFNPHVLAGNHATHYLIDRRYLADEGGVADEPAMVLFEGYLHEFTDTEFIATARYRGVFVACLSSVVEHLHPLAGKAEVDSTYAKGYLRPSNDNVLFEERMRKFGIPVDE